MTNDDIRKQIEWLRGELKRRETIAEEGLPHIDDLKYSFLTEPPRWEESLRPAQAPFLSSANLWQGRSYRLTAGQRSWLRDRYEMSASQTVTVVGLSLWGGSPHPREMTLRCDFHKANDVRGLVTTVIVREVGTFLSESYTRDEFAKMAKWRYAGVSRKDAVGGGGATGVGRGEFAGFVAELEALLSSSGGE